MRAGAALCPLAQALEPVAAQAEGLAQASARELVQAVEA